MGLFSKLTEKKECGVCGKELGLLGKSKVEDGYLCKECRGKLSPFFSETRHTTLAGIQEQLDCREANKELVAAFNPTRELGERWRVLIDDSSRGVIVTSDRDWRSGNPDVVPFDKVHGADVRVHEDRAELTYRDGEGNERHYEPPRYEENYDFWITVRTGVPYIGNIEFKLNDWDVQDRWGFDYGRCERTAADICEALRNLNAPTPQQVPTPKTAPIRPEFCTSCGAPTAPGTRSCEFCGKQWS